MAVKSTFRSSNYTSESFQSTAFQFSLEKLCLALQKFHKAQTTNTPPTHHRRISYVIKLNSCQRVGRQSADSRSTVGRLSTDRRPTVDRRVGRRVGGIGFLTYPLSRLNILISRNRFMSSLKVLCFSFNGFSKRVYAINYSPRRIHHQ